MTIFKSPYPSIQIPEVPLYELVLSNCDRLGDKVAIIDGTTGFKLTYRELKQQVQIVAANLAKQFEDCASSASDHSQPVLAIHLPNHPMYPVLFHGANMAGAAVTTLNFLYTPWDINHVLSDSRASVLVTVQSSLDKILSAIDQPTKTHNLKKIFVLNMTDEHRNGGVAILDANLLWQQSATDRAFEPARIQPKSTISALPYSSGTTGVSKGVMLSHYNILADTVNTELPEPFSENDVLVAVLPFFHIYALQVILCKGLYRGTTVVMMPKYDQSKFIEILQKYSVTRAHLVPPLVLALAKLPHVVDLPALKTIVSGAAPLSRELHEMFKKKYPHIVLKQGYGMTECSAVCACSSDNDIVPGSVGQLLPNTEARVVDTQSGTELDVNQEGELLIRGPQVMLGYLNNQQATAATLDTDGWLRTGDVCRIDENGHIFIVDRVKELIKYKGYQVAPAELEGLLLKLDGVADVCVVGIPDEEAGEIPTAFVVRKQGSVITEQQVISFVEEKVAPYKKVRSVQFVEQIAKSPSGKILRRVFKQQHSKQPAASSIC